ncbi:MAG TPA: DNA polymerase III subunit gamma/tau [Candidatus Dormibacteraeota bacterium]
MSSNYQTLYRKYRSQTFSDLVGQEAISRALQGAIASDRVAHAYLFSGSRGTGKTSSARLLAKAVNCLQRQTGVAEPCNRCDSCVQISAGAALDLIEIDAASNRGIDEIRDLREKVHLAPALGRRKVYIVDEAHMLTTEAFNALLKTLEEPPEHVVFILCTTEAQKVPLTVLGRCQQFVFRRFSDEQVVARLRHIAEREGIAVEPEALSLIARMAQGSMRDAVGLLDQLVPLAGAGVTVAGARELLGIADPAQVDALVAAVLQGRPTEALDRLAAIYEAGGELRQVVRGIMERCRDLLVQAIEAREAGRRERLSAVLDALLHLDGEVRRHAEPRFLVEATLVRLAVERETTSPRSGEVAPAPQEPERVGTMVSQELAPAPAAPADLTEGWRRVLDQLSVQDRAPFLAARLALQDTTLVLTFAYAFHHQKARDTGPKLAPLIAAWLGPGITVDYRLQDGGAAAAPGTTPRATAPEEHEMVQRAVRQLEGRVTKVSTPKVKESQP